MEPSFLVVIMLMATIWTGLVGLTVIGASRRGHTRTMAVIQGLFFPLTWVTWYVHDERPFHRRHAKTTVRSA